MRRFGLVFLNNVPKKFSSSQSALKQLLVPFYRKVDLPSKKKVPTAKTTIARPVRSAPPEYDVLSDGTGTSSSMGRFLESFNLQHMLAA